MPKIFYSPKWRHYELTIPASTTLEVPPEIWANNTAWPWHLQFLSLVHELTPITDIGEGAPGGGNALGTSRHMRWRMGLSQRGEINLNPTRAATLLTQKSMVQLGSTPIDHMGFTLKLPRPFVLPKDNGITVQAQSNFDDFDTEATAIVRGYRRLGDGTRIPAQLMGKYELVEQGQNIEISSVDLFNDGNHDFYINTIGLLENTLNALEASLLDGAHNLLEANRPNGHRMAYRINPSTGVPWMAEPDMIPVGNIAPFTAVHDVYDCSPRAYEFPEGSILNPRQRFWLEIQNVSAVAKVVHLCLFGLLEVS